MKNISFALLAGLFIIFVPDSSKAQQRTAYADAVDLVNVNGTTVRVANLYTLDSLKVPHYTSFDIEVSSDGDTKKVLELFFNSLQNKQSFQLSEQKLDFQYHIQETRNYKGAIVVDIVVPDLNASSKDVVKFRVKILATDLAINNDGGQANVKLAQQTKRAIQSNFKLVMGALPAQRTIAITNLRMTNFLANGYINFSIDIARADSKLWKDWFNTGAGGGKLEQGTITLLDPALSGDIATMQLASVEIVSVSEMDGTGDNVAKTTIGLRARRLNFTLNAK
jgi:hypothetical protein